MRFIAPFVLTSLALFGQAARQQNQQPAGQQKSQQEDLLERTKAAAKAAIEQQKAAQIAQPAKPEAPAQAAPALNVMSLDPEKVVATVDGNPVPAGQLQAIIGTLGPEVQAQAAGNIRAVLEQYGVMRRLSAMAEKAKLDQENPYKHVLDVTRMRILSQAEISHFFNTQIQVPEDAVKTQYEKDKDKFQQARVKAIYIPFSSSQAQPADPKAPKPVTEPEAKSQADHVVSLARGGADFVKLVKEYSKDSNSAAKDGDFGVVARNSPIPEHVKTAIFAAKPGSVTDPVRQPNGFYIFRVEEITTPPIEQVRNNIIDQIKNAKFSEWIQEQQRNVKIEGLISSAGQPQQPQAQTAK